MKSTNKSHAEMNKKINDGEMNHTLWYLLISFSLKLYIALIVCGSIGHLSFNRKNLEHSSENTVHAVILITLLTILYLIWRT